jgi:hypothetical protein
MPLAPQVDTIVRAGVDFLDPKIDEPNLADVDDLLQLLDIAPFDALGDPVSPPPDPGVRRSV